MISTSDLIDNPAEPAERDWLASELFPKSPRGFPAVRLTPEIERQMRLRDRMVLDLRDWMASRDAADSRCGSCGRG